MPKKEPIFSDIDPDLRVDYQGNLVVLENTEAVNASLENLFGTSPGERVMHPNWGCEMSTVVGQPATETTASFVEMIVDKTLRENEPRVELIETKVEPLPEENELRVQIHYKLSVVFIRGLFERILSLDEG